MREERIQKVMADNGLCSRRAAEAIIAEGRVKVNGRPVKLGDKMNPGKDLLSIDGNTIPISKNPDRIYLMLYKPRGYITSLKDEQGRKTIMDLLSDIKVRIYPIGRLDKDSEGLLLLTNDGDFAQQLAHPSHGVSKMYRVTVDSIASEDSLATLASGVVLDDGEKTQPASLRVIEESENRSVLEITIKEGKYRQVRRMCEAVGLNVIRLKRNSQGPLKLGMLKPGRYRELTPAEVIALKASAAKATRQNKQTTQRASKPKSRPAAPKKWGTKPTKRKGV